MYVRGGEFEQVAPISCLYYLRAWIRRELPRGQLTRSVWSAFIDGQDALFFDKDLVISTKQLSL